MQRRSRRAILVTGAVAAAALIIATAAAPSIAAGGLLHPARHRTDASPPPGCKESEFQGTGVTLRGWSCPAVSPRGTVVYLHGVADNRGSAAGAVPRFLSHGLNVVAYDSRAHGDSDGDMCTYGYFEKQDLHRVIDTVSQPVFAIGTSLGGAVALQAAAEDERISGVVAAEVFSDLQTIARQRAPLFLTPGIVSSAFQIAEARGHFRIDAVSPVAAAARIHVPVLLIHGEADHETRPEHSRAVYAALNGPKQLVIVPGAGHNESLGAADAWRAIDRWIGERLASTAGPR